MLDGSFVPLSTPTPKRRVPIATKHLRLTKREYIDYKWDAIKHYFGKIKRKLSGWTLPNIASLIFILFMTKMFYEDNHQFIKNFFTSNNAKMAEPIMTSLNEMSFRMSMILEQQELIKKLNNDEMHILRKELEHSIESFKKDYLREMDNYTSKIASIQIELSNISRAQNEISSKMEKNFSDVEKNFSNIEKNFSNIEKNLSRMEELVNNQSISSRSQTEYHGVNLANRKFGAKNVPELSSDLFTSKYYLNRLSNYVYRQEILNWPLMDRVTVNEGDAFCFNGNTGDYTVQLASKMNLKSVIYEHDYWRDLVPISAPKNYQIWTCKKGCNSINSFDLAASCVYSSRDSPAQLCNLTANTEDVHSIRMRILSNYGQEYTCIYVLRVFGA